MSTRPKPAETARQMYLLVYRKHKTLPLDKVLDICTLVMDKVIETMPEKTFKPGLIGEEPNPELEYWRKVRNELEKTLS